MLTVLFSGLSCILQSVSLSSDFLELDGKFSLSPEAFEPEAIDGKFDRLRKLIICGGYIEVS